MRSLDARSTDQLADDLALLSAQLASTLCRWLQLLGEFDRRRGWVEAGARSCAQWVGWRCALSPGTAREYVRVAGALGDLPRTTELFSRGELSYSKVRAISRLERVEFEAELLGIARDATAAQLERVVRGYRSVVRLERDALTTHVERFLSLREEPDGSVRLSGRLTAEEAAVLRAALDEVRTQLWSQADARVPDPVEDPAADRTDPKSARRAGYADALVLLADTALAREAAGRSAPERHQVVVHVDVGSLHAAAPEEAPRPNLASGEILAPSVARRLCCDATLVTATDRDGVTVDIGRRSRAIPPALRRMLSARDDGCRFPGCTARLGLDAHHVQHWADGGATRPDNLVTLCRHHHRALHEGGFTMSMEPDAPPLFFRPDGSVLETHPPAACVEGRTRGRRRNVSAGTLAAGSNQSYDKGLAVAAVLRMAPPGRSRGET